MVRPHELEDLRLGPEELRLSGLRLFGETSGWQTRLATHLGVDRSSVTRWLSGAVPVPLGASLLVRYMLMHGLPDTAGVRGGAIPGEDQGRS